ncbi:MAG: beta-propeller fold lactonase family protein [Gammaproteobacteria bacterium]
MNRRLALSALISVLAGGASGTAMAKDTGYLFVSSEKDHSVTVFDSQSYQVVKTIRTAARPRHLQFNPQRTIIYAACGDGNAVDIIDVAKLELVDRIAEIDDPEAFDFSPDGKTMYISLEDDAKLGILDLDEYFAKRQEKPELAVAEVTDTDEEGGDDDDDEDEGDEKDGNEDDELLEGMTTVEVGPEPEGILTSPDGKTVYVTSEVANTVHVVDVESKALTANIVVGDRPRRFALTPDEKELWVTNELAASVSIIDKAAGTVEETIVFEPKGFRPEDVTPVGITMTRDGKTAFVALGRANHVAVVDVASRAIEDYILVGTRAWNATLNRDESTLYVVNGLSDDVSVVDVARRKVVKSFPTPRVPYALLIDD